MGNKCDIKEQKVAVGEALDLAKKEGMGYMQTSAALGTNVNEAFDLLTRKIVERVSDLSKSKKKAARKGKPTKPQQPK